MDEQTAAFDELADLDRPIDLQTVDEQPLLFYLAGKVPFSMDKLAAESKQGESAAAEILYDRFRRELNTDQTGFVRLSDAARNAVVSYGKQFITEARNTSSEGDSLREEDKLEAAGNKYERAARLLTAIRDRFEEVNYVPEQLDESIDRLQNKSDAVRKQHAKETYKHRSLLANQREEDGDEAFRAEDFETAMDSFKSAFAALRTARETVKSYNENRLAADSPKLRTDSLTDRVNAIKRKYGRAKKRATKATEDAETAPEVEAPRDQDEKSRTTQSPPDTGTPSAKPTTTADESPTREELIAAIDDLTRQLGGAPKASEMDDQGRFASQRYVDTFGSWREALESASVDVRAELIDDLRRIGRNLERAPTTAEIDELGRFDSDWYGQYFDTRADALEAAGLPEASDSELIQEIRRLDLEYDQIPTTDLLRAEGQYSPQTYFERFGRWESALEEAGIDKRARLIQELRRIDEDCEGKLTTDIVDDRSKCDVEYFTDEFGSWEEVLAAAGLADESDTAPGPSTDTEARVQQEEPTDEELIAELQRLAAESSDVPTGNGMKNRGKYDPWTYHDRFGGWDDALEVAGVTGDTASNISPESTDSSGATAESDQSSEAEHDDAGPMADDDAPTKQELIDEIRRLDHEYDKMPTRNEIRERGKFSEKIYYDRFGSWDAALEAAGIDKRERLIAELQRIDSERDGQPTSTLVDEIGQFSSGYYTHTFGSWSDALAAAGITAESSTDSASESDGSHASAGESEPTEQELIDEIKRLDETHETIPKSTLMRDEGRYDLDQYYSRFGDWDDALAAAGIDKQQRLVDELDRISEDHDDPLTPSIVDEQSEYSAGYFVNEFGTWENVLDAVGTTSQSTPTDEELLAELRRLNERTSGDTIGNAVILEGKYKPALYHRRFGGLEEAMEVAGIEMPSSPEPDTPGDEPSGETADRETVDRADTKSHDEQDGIPPNELAELYESLRLLHKVLDEYIETTGSQPLAQWRNIIETAVFGDGVSEKIPCLGKLHAEYNPFSMADYRDQYGNGDYVTEFEALETGTPSKVDIVQLNRKIDFPARDLKLPVSPDSGNPLPVLVSSEAELESATSQLHETITAVLPTHYRHLAETDSVSETIESANAAETGDIPPNELAELYESISLLNTVLNEYVSTADDIEVGSDDPIAQWQAFIEDAVFGDGVLPEIPSLGKLHAEYNDFAMDQYRERYGNGDYVTEFEALDTETLGGVDVVQINRAVDFPARDLHLPVNPETGNPLPLLPSTDAELSDGRSALETIIADTAPQKTQADPVETASVETTDATTAPDSSQESPTASTDAPTTAGQDSGGEIPPNGLAELYDCLDLLDILLTQYLQASSDTELGSDTPLGQWQQTIEQVVIGDGLGDEAPSLQQLHADRNSFSMEQYRHRYGNDDYVTDFEIIETDTLDTVEIPKLNRKVDFPVRDLRLPVSSSTGSKLPALISSREELRQAQSVLAEIVGYVLDIDVSDSSIEADDIATDAAPTTASATADTTSDTEPQPTTGSDFLTLADVEPNETYDGPLVGRLSGYIANPSGDASSQLHFTDTTGEDFWLYVVDQDSEHEWEKGNWYFISTFRGPEERGGGRGAEALRSTPEMSVEDHGSTLPPGIDADVSTQDTTRSKTTSTTSTTSTSTQTSATTDSTTTASTSMDTETADSDDTDEEAEATEETDPMVAEFLEDMEDNDLL